MRLAVVIRIPAAKTHGSECLQLRGTKDDAWVPEVILGHAARGAGRTTCSGLSAGRRRLSCQEVPVGPGLGTTTAPVRAPSHVRVVVIVVCHFEVIRTS